MPPVRTGARVLRICKELETFARILFIPGQNSIACMGDEVDNVDDFTRSGVDVGVPPVFRSLYLDNVCEKASAVGEMDVFEFDWGRVVLLVEEYLAIGGAFYGV